MLLLLAVLSLKIQNELKSMNLVCQRNYNHLYGSTLMETSKTTEAHGSYCRNEQS
jgi:hypothetical protein